ncbi:flavin reductase family protein [Planococcus liqunii]|uniref:Flavin reductase family protein n=1 Tax=Planococcus liqunii TaxID=3058394 RepID=A0ABT8MUP6_9BACL|nr:MULTISPECIES: flavin reductase family protein [unclassified Planococcus (in: firmicutes)]MDN7228431.1 flavin reductase family protein [Planococcus sp. N064]WKA50935.1 flavin reductase family protein [Planococcus sp. N056]
MLSIDPNQQTERENYKLLVGTVIPRPIAFVTSMSADGLVNAAPFSYFNIVSSDPPLLSISVQSRAGVLKDTARNAIEAREFVIHVVDESNVAEVNKTAASLSPEESEIDLTGLTLIPSEVVKVPSVEQAKVRFECQLEQAVELGGTRLLIGKVVRFHIDESIYENGRINPEALKPVSRLAGTNYAKLGEIFSMKRPD